MPLPDSTAWSTCSRSRRRRPASSGSTPATRRLVDGAFGAHSWLRAAGVRAAGLARPARRCRGCAARCRVTAPRSARIDVDRLDAGRMPRRTRGSRCWSPTTAPRWTSYARADPLRRRPDRRRAAAARCGSPCSPPGPRDQQLRRQPGVRRRAHRATSLPRLLEAFPTDHRPVLSGQSLGGLAALHAAWTSPGTFGGLLLQSGSFFTAGARRPGVRRTPHWAAVTGFVALRARRHARAAPGAAAGSTITCGTAEENLANNRLMARPARRHRASTSTWGEVRQGHTWTCWRDPLDPHLTDLLHGGVGG